MKKIKLLIISLMILLWDSSLSFSAEIWGRPIAPGQARFYLFTLGLIAFSIFIVGATYLILWFLDARKKSKTCPSVLTSHNRLGQLKNAVTPVVK